MKILIDTNILIFLLALDDNAPDIEVNGVFVNAKVVREWFYEYTKDQSICISTVTLAEFLHKIDDDKKAEYINLIKNIAKIEILSFDELAAYELAGLPTLKDWKKIANGLERNALMLKLDRQIIATAIAYGVDELWTNDKDMLKLLQSLGNSHIQNKKPKNPMPRSFNTISLEGTMDDLFE